jgi:AcrR family transcriptional regulator
LGHGISFKNKKALHSSKNRNNPIPNFELRHSQHLCTPSTNNIMDNVRCPHEESMTVQTGTSAARSTYRHGDLRRALLDAGIALARTGGPDAVVLREATRQAGVVPNAAYRHFASRQDLLLAVRAHALSALAIAMESEIAQLRDDEQSTEFARGSLRAVGIGYLTFAHAEPGLFRTAFSAPLNGEPEPDPAWAGNSGLNPFQLLSAALDRMAKAGLLLGERRRDAEYLAWSAVHGLAVLVTDGPLWTLNDEQRLAIGQRLVDMVEKGLSSK